MSSTDRSQAPPPSDRGARPEPTSSHRRDLARSATDGWPSVDEWREQRIRLRAAEAAEPSAAAPPDTNPPPSEPSQPQSDTPHEAPPTQQAAPDTTPTSPSPEPSTSLDPGGDEEGAQDVLPRPQNGPPHPDDSQDPRGDTPSAEARSKAGTADDWHSKVLAGSSWFAPDQNDGGTGWPTKGRRSGGSGRKSGRSGKRSRWSDREPDGPEGTAGWPGEETGRSGGSSGEPDPEEGTDRLGNAYGKRGRSSRIRNRSGRSSNGEPEPHDSEAGFHDGETEPRGGRIGSSSSDARPYGGETGSSDGDAALHGGAGRPHGGEAGWSYGGEGEPTAGESGLSGGGAWSSGDGSGFSSGVGGSRDGEAGPHGGEAGSSGGEAWPSGEGSGFSGGDAGLYGGGVGGLRGSDAGPRGSESGPPGGDGGSSGGDAWPYGGGGNARGRGGGRRGGRRNGNGGRKRGWLPEGPDEGSAAGAQAHADPESVARAICLRLLTMAPKTRAQLAEALRKRDVPEEAAEAVLSRFSELGLINDEAFAEAWVDSRHHGRGLAKRALAAELRHRGVDSDTVNEAVERLDPDQEAETARKLVERKLASTRSLDPQVRTRRLAGMLARKGYPSGLAFRVIREALEQEGIEIEEDFS
ncbi:RecX family transcriptional regulator [Nonomuraea sp. NPDC048882]|uniref:RecX family transcriptional regulator n=2 Tax=unclassified Nonomuraea TaxID=2593643 RepID=UPI00340424F3